MNELEPVVNAKLELERMSVDELRERIADLKREIGACEAELAKKERHRSAADALFGEN